MTKIRPRIIETDEGIQGDFNVTTYDKMQRRLRDKGWIETNRIVAFGIEKGGMEAFLKNYNFNLIENLNSEDLEKMFFRDENGNIIAKINGTHSRKMKEERQSPVLYLKINGCLNYKLRTISCLLQQVFFIILMKIK